MATTRRPGSSTPRAAHPGIPKPTSPRGSSSGPADELRARGKDAQGAEVKSSVPGNAAGEKKPTSEYQPKAKTKKPGAFVRIWSEADELSILECLAAHVKKHGAPPVRSQLPGVLAGCRLDKEEFTVTEIYEKVRRLRIQYKKMLSAPRQLPGDIGGGRNKFDLSMAIWGKAIAPVPTAPAKSTKKVGGPNLAWGTRARRDLEELRHLYPDLVDAVDRTNASNHGGRVGDVLKKGLELIDDDTAGQLNAKAKKQRLREINMMLNRADLRKEL
ncbi:hypothetical protein E2562_035845 [Oryza meyeriana var. granulata]|uniref:Glabrous enhancer-binding protein-like DBD domain-containing protein n=1 Tax=Oryza meyeriana var. granulata TaxID=110450 RepID=A0A6G1DTC7_9ORYZ|nr:hypothetical protein E2562_035845 [Oryza meyeriana var. granulata]